MNTELRDLKNQISSYRKNWRYCFSYIFSLGGIDKKLTRTQRQIDAILQKSSEKIKNISILQQEKNFRTQSIDAEDLNKSNTSKQEAAVLREENVAGIEVIKENLKAQSKFFKNI